MSENKIKQNMKTQGFKITAVNQTLQSYTDTRGNTVTRYIN